MSNSHVPADLKRLVLERAQGLCEYCRSPERYSAQTFSVEHIIPRVHEGPTAADNLALACQGCNNHKFSKTEASDPISGEIVPLFHPRRQRWADHFAWNEDASLVLGISPVGRATVEALCLNREGLTNLRRLLFIAGVHPPDA